jgi:hypothetical protein
MIEPQALIALWTGRHGEPDLQRFMAQLRLRCSVSDRSSLGAVSTLASLPPLAREAPLLSGGELVLLITPGGLVQFRASGYAVLQSWKPRVLSLCS